jgi:hypothetical protein
MLARKWNLTIKLICVIVIALLGLVFIRNLVDFPVYYAAGQSLLQGRSDLYAEDFASGRVMDYRYPPFFLLAFSPLWLLPFKFAAYLWYLFSVFEIIGCLLFLSRLLRPLVIKKVAWMVITIAVLQYFIIVLHYGNAHLLVIFLLFGALFFGLRGNDWKAACLMALAISIKLIPAFVLLYLLLKKRWKFLCLVGALVIAINILPSLFFGLEKNTELLNNWYQKVVINQEFHEMNGPINLSFKGQLRRYFTEIHYHERVDGDTRYPVVNIASLPENLVDTIWLVVSGLLVILVSYVIYQGRREKAFIESSESGQQKGWNDSSETLTNSLMEMGVLISLMLFVEPLTSKIYFIALLWPVVVLATMGFSQSSADHRLGKRIVMLIAILNFVLPLLPGRSIQRWLLVLGADFYVNLLLLLAQLVYLIGSRKGHQLKVDEQQRPVP